MSERYNVFLDGKLVYGEFSLDNDRNDRGQIIGGEKPSPLFKIKLEDGREFDVIDVQETETEYIFISYFWQIKANKADIKVTKEFEEFIEKVVRKK